MGSVDHARRIGWQARNRAVRVGQTNQRPVARSQALRRHLMRAQTQQLVVRIAHRKAGPRDEQQGRCAQPRGFGGLGGQPAQRPLCQGVHRLKQHRWLTHAQGMAARGRCKVQQRLAQYGRVRGVRHGQRIKLRPLRVCCPASSTARSPGHSRNNSGNRNRPCSAPWSWSAPRHAAPHPPCANGGTHP